jgi:hypothetical protein
MKKREKWVVVRDTTGGGEQGTEENIWTKEEWSDGRVEKAA